MEKDTKVVIGAISVLVIMIFVFNLGLNGKIINKKVTGESIKDITGEPIKVLTYPLLFIGKITCTASVGGCENTLDDKLNTGFAIGRYKNVFVQYNFAKNDIKEIHIFPSSYFQNAYLQYSDGSTKYIGGLNANQWNRIIVNKKDLTYIKVLWDANKHKTGLFEVRIYRQNSCVDTDNGKMYNIKGTTTATFPANGYSDTRTDICNADGTLKEWYCGNPGSAIGLLKFEDIVCPDQCRDGKCIMRTVTYKDGDPYIGEDPTNPNWVWNLKGLTISNPRFNEQKFGIRNSFIKDDDTDDPAGIGECYTLPNNYAKICFDGLTLSPTASQSIIITSEKESGIPGLPDNEGLIKVYSPGSNRFILRARDITISTSKFWIIRTPAGAPYGRELDSFRVFYYDPNNVPNVKFLKSVGLDINSYIGETTAGADGAKYLISIRTNTADITPFVSVVFQDLNNENIYIKFKYNNNEILSLGETNSLAESKELTWMDTRNPPYEEAQIGTKNIDILSAYGTIIKNPKLNGALDKVILLIPNEKIKGRISIYPSLGSGTGPSIYSSLLGAPLITNEDLGYMSGFGVMDGRYIFNWNRPYTNGAVSLETSLTSSDDDYGINVFMEITRNAIEFNRPTSVSPGWPIEFLGRTFRIVSMTDNSITVQ